VNDDFVEWLHALVAQSARFLVVGAHALAIHGIPRATQDLDVLIEPTPENAIRVWNALAAFGAPMGELQITTADLARDDLAVQLGLPPRRIDLLSSISGVRFDEAWAGRHEQEVSGKIIPFLGRAATIANKRAAGRVRDLSDLEALGEPPPS
jgi:hypothetical protein